MERRVNFAPGEYYHIYNRGTEKRKIFLSAKDYQRFLVLLHLSNNHEAVHLSNLTYQGLPLLELLNEKVKSRLVAVGAYCLMPNHFHLLLYEKQAGGITKFMLKLETAYSMYFNKKNERKGHLFQGTFQSESVAGDDNYLRYLYAYIHLNPLKIIDRDWREKIPSLNQSNRLLDYLDAYSYSSYPDYLLKGRSQSIILTPAAFPEYFGSPEEHRAELADWLNYQGLPSL